jgi:hypothetical protein
MATNDIFSGSLGPITAQPVINSITPVDGAQSYMSQPGGYFDKFGNFVNSGPSTPLDFEGNPIIGYTAVQPPDGSTWTYDDVGNRTASPIPPAYTEMPQMPESILYDGGLGPISAQPVINTVLQTPSNAAYSLPTLQKSSDYFESYFPVTVTGGTTNPMVGADVVQGPNPQALGLDPILAAIQSQYTPQTFTHSGGSYGAGRFIDDTFGTGGGGAPVTAPSWFTPGEFDINAYSSNLPTEVAEQVATGSVYGGDSPTSNLGTYDPNDPYASWNALQIPRIGQNLIGSLIPGAGLAIGAAQGYQNAQLANAMQTGVGAYGGEPNMGASSLKSALLGAIGQQEQGVENARALSSQFSSPESMYGYFDAAQDPATNPVAAISQGLLANAGNQSTLTPDQVGVIGQAVGAAINDYVSQGMTLDQATNAASLDFGVVPATIAPSATQSWSPAASNDAFMAAIGQPTSPVGDPIAAMNELEGWTNTAPSTPVVGTSDNGGMGTPTSQTGGIVTSGDGSFVRSGDGSVVTWGDYTAPSVAPAGNNPDEADPSDTSGGGGGGTSTKIVCTAMNQSYGFGSYRNAIWLKYSADKMTKAHEAGYHAIFLPLVDLAYKRNNKPIRIALEHIARHRTADLRAEMRGSKRDTLGRAYRFVLEPLCYVVGKIKGY